MYAYRGKRRESSSMQLGASAYVFQKCSAIFGEPVDRLDRFGMERNPLSMLRDGDVGLTN